ncbi:MAG: hypothetical protein M5R41_06345 [Bacteroidia bacterium]|nr:hypothetical protein [Bacteroidia bacterium]
MDSAMNESLLQNLENVEQVLKKSYQQLMEIMSKSGCHMDFYTIGTVKRSLSLANAFILLIRNQNYFVPSALLRLQIDNCLRYHATYLVADPNIFAEAIMNGERIDHYRDRTNHKMRDGYLVDSLSDKYPWVRLLYDEACKDVHLSDKHLLSIFSSTDQQSFTARIEVSPFDRYIDFDEWKHLIDDFTMITVLLNTLVEGWIREKRSKQKSTGSTEIIPDG